MANVKIRELDKYKKSLAGFTQFATLIEQAPPEKRARLLEQVGEVDPVFVRAVLRKVVFFEEFDYLKGEIAAEVLSHVNPKLLALALCETPERFQKAILGRLNPQRMKATLEEMDNLKRQPPMNLIQSARAQILKIARNLEKKNHFEFEIADCPRFHEKRAPKLRLVRNTLDPD